MKKLDHHTMGDDELVALFETSFEEQIAKKCDIQEYNVAVSRSTASDKIAFEVTVSGMAGTPSIDDFKRGKVNGCETINLTRPDKGSIQLNLVKKEITFLSGNDYLLIYANT